LRREYPDSPVAGVAAIVFSGESVLLVRRGNEPSRGRWGLPGGVVELGEGVEEAMVREVGEETSVTVRPTRLLTVFDSIVRDEEDKIRYHYILCEYLCEAVEGEPRAATDVSDAMWAPLEDLESLDMTRGTRRFIERVRAGEYS
jgi:ADP-ribose pyrophosphatase YjhB (NUDIX family)